MSEYEEALKKWKEHDPYLLDFEGFQRLLAEKEKEEKARLTVSLNHDYSYTIFMELADITFDKYLEENGISRYDQNRILHLEKLFMERLKEIDLRNGATYVFRKDGEWFYWGDFDHCPKEDIMYNVEQLCKFWEAVGTHIKGGFGVSKAFDRTLYVNTLAKTEHRLPRIRIMRYDMGAFLRNINRQPTYSLKEPEVELSDEWLKLEELTEALLPYSEIDRDWLDRIDELIPVAVVYRESVVGVEKFIAKGKEEWNPFTDIQIQRNGVFDLLHPVLQKELNLVWDDSLVVWEQTAKEARTIFYRKFSSDELESKKVADIREVCRVKRLDARGRKEDLIERIQDFDTKILPKIKVEPSEAVYDYRSVW